MKDLKWANNLHGVECRRQITDCKYFDRTRRFQNSTNDTSKKFHMGLVLLRKTYVKGQKYKMVQARTRLASNVMAKDHSISCKPGNKIINNDGKTGKVI